MKHVSPYASKDLIYIYDNLDSPFLINPLNIRTQIRKSLSVSMESKDVTRMTTLRFAKKHTHTRALMLLQSQIFALVPELKIHSGAADAGRHQQLYILMPIKHILRRFWLSHKQAIEMLTIMILSFTREDGERESERQTHTESQIS